MSQINNPFAGGKITKQKGTCEYDVENIGIVTFKVDKNLSIYDVTPRKYLGRDILSVVRGQVPDAGAQSLANAVYKWMAEDARYNNQLTN